MVNTSIDLNTILLALISAVVTLYGLKLSAASKRTEESTKKTEVSTDLIHTAVNSERTAREALITKLNEVVLSLSKDKTKLLAEAETSRVDKAVTAAAAAEKSKT